MDSAMRRTAEYSMLRPIAQVCPSRDIGIRSGRFFGEDDGKSGLKVAFAWA